MQVVMELLCLPTSLDNHNDHVDTLRPTFSMQCDVESALRTSQVGGEKIMSLSGFEPLASRICGKISHNVMI